MAAQSQVALHLSLIRAVFLLLWGLPVLAMAQISPAPRAEPEEPDFAFLSGSAYTQIKNSLQVIHQTSYRASRFVVPDGRRTEEEFVFFQRTEFGITDRWELDVITPAAGSRERIGNRTVRSDFAFADSTLGARYRLSSEESSLFTVAAGPQIVLPTGSVRHGTGTGSVAFAWDAAASKDWGGPVFFFSTFNYKATPWADDPGSSRQFILHDLEWAAAVGLRALERFRADTKHDIHLFFEAGGGWGQEVEAGTRFGQHSQVFYPGIRYGFLTSGKTLIEIGAAIPIGIGPNSLKNGVVVQFQFESLLGPLAD